MEDSQPQELDIRFCNLPHVISYFDGEKLVHIENPKIIEHHQEDVLVDGIKTGTKYIFTIHVEK